jgi:hypothetical protein
MRCILHFLLFAVQVVLIVRSSIERWHCEQRRRPSKRPICGVSFHQPASEWKEISLSPPMSVPLSPWHSQSQTPSCRPPEWAATALGAAAFRYITETKPKRFSVCSTGEVATCWYVLLSGSVYIDGSMFLPRHRSVHFSLSRRTLFNSENAPRCRNLKLFPRGPTCPNQASPFWWSTVDLILVG